MANIIKINGKDIKDVKATQDIADLKSQMSDFGEPLSRTINYALFPVSVEYIHGTINSSGEIDTSNTQRIVTSNILQFDDDTQIKALRLSSNSNTLIDGRFYDANGDPTSETFNLRTYGGVIPDTIVIPKGSRFRYHVYTDPTQPENVDISVLADIVVIGLTEKGNFDKLKNQIDTEIMFGVTSDPVSYFNVTGYYSKATGTFNATGNYKTTEYLDIDYLQNKTFSYVFPTSASANKVTLFNADKVYVGYSMSATDRTSLLAIAPTAKYVRFSCLNSNLSGLKLISTIMSGKMIYSADIFARVGCIGDSYTAGFINIDGQEHTNNTYPLYSWPTQMSHLTGREWTNFGKGGSSTKSWMNGAGRLDEVQASGNKCQAYVIGLGINDITSSSSSVKVSLGTSADIGTDADSYYAYYYKLVKAVYAVNNDAKIFCTTLPQSLTNVAGYNQAVKDIVSYCDNEGVHIFLLDLAGDYFTDGLYANAMYSTDKINGHYTAIGYNFMAECYREVISDVINHNVADFQDVFLIDYDEPT